MDGFGMAFHDLHHTFATMIIAGGNARFTHYVRTMASYLGHANVAMTLNTYPEVDPDAKANTTLITGSYCGLGARFANIHIKAAGDLILVGRGQS
ncbi:MAG: hypothetical protein IJG88_00035 [Eggerthellaceae bacterium]|nr:hypothetical protein [Eggerthellaceae bacterium]